MTTNSCVGVVGGGAWGTALAVLANRAGNDVMLATRNAYVAASVTERRMNDIYLPGIFIDPAIQVTLDFSDLSDCGAIIMAMPSHCMRSACIAISDFIGEGVPLVIGAKGIERGSLLLMSEVAAGVLPKNPIAVLSGPNFAHEAAKGLPTATTIACADAEVGKKLVFTLGGKLFRPYLTDDLIGTQIGGALKNVIAIACGVAIGKGLGENAKAALVTRGFAEMSRLCLARGGRYETLMGLSGLGDLVLTAMSETSRNTNFGIALSTGKSAEEVLMADGRGVIEGAVTVESVVKMAAKFGVEMPICEAVHDLILGKSDPDSVINKLLDRPFAVEKIC